MKDARVVIVTDMAPPYRYPAWDQLARHVAELHVLLCTEKEANRIWDTSELKDRRFSVRVLPGRSFFIKERDMSVHLNPTLLSELRSLRPSHIVVTGYHNPSYITAIVYAVLTKTALTTWWGSHKLSSRSHTGLISWLRRTIVRFSDSYVTYGSMATEYLLSIGIPSERVITSCNTVDVTQISKLVQRYREEGSEYISSCTRVRFLYVGQFLERKGVLELAEAFASLPAEQAELAFVGYGPLEAALRTRVSELGLTNVTFPGPTRTLAETVKHLAAADVLVMPSLLEVWGLVINEALAAGAYVLSSRYAGATPDLVLRAPTDVGRVIDPLDACEFVQALEDTVRLVRDGGLDRTAIAEWGCSLTPEQYGHDVAQACLIVERISAKA